MKEKKKQVMQWVKEHKKQLIIGGISITAIIGIVVGIKNREALDELWITLNKSINNSPNITDSSLVRNTSNAIPDIKKDVIPNPEYLPLERYHAQPLEPFEVSKHVRTLPKGRHASPDKIATATEQGFTLGPNQTWVCPYIKGTKAA